jgi:hypothetical protein
VTAQPTEGRTYWAVIISEDSCAVVEVDSTRVLPLGWLLFKTEREALSCALSRSEHLAGYWERQTDQLRRRLHEIAVRGENA